LNRTDLSFTPIASFVGLRGVPLLSIWSNSFNPLVSIVGDCLSIRSFGAHVIPLADIERIRLRKLAGWQFTILPRKGPFTYSATFLQQEGLRLARALEGRAEIVPAETLARLSGVSAQ
jgi:hypothetical protein